MLMIFSRVISSPNNTFLTISTTLRKPILFLLKNDNGSYFFSQNNNDLIAFRLALKLSCKPSQFKNPLKLENRYH